MRAIHTENSEARTISILYILPPQVSCKSPGLTLEKLHEKSRSTICDGDLPKNPLDSVREGRKFRNRKSAGWTS